MHEMSLMTNLMGEIQLVAAREGATRVVAVKVRLGALSHMSPPHFREHFALAAKGSLAASAVLDIEVSQDREDPHATGIVIEGLEVERA